MLELAPTPPVKADLLDADDVLLVRRLRDGFPLSERPYADLAAELGWSEDDVMARLRRLLACGALTHFGPTIEEAAAGKARLLAALQVPEARFDEVARILGTLPAVLQSLRREHRFNLWLTVAGRSAADLRDTCARIEAMTGLPVYRFPRQKSFFLEPRLDALQTRSAWRSRSTLA